MTSGDAADGGTSTPPSGWQHLPFRRALRALLTDGGVTRHPEAWVARVLYVPTSHAAGLVAGTRPPSLADCYDLARVFGVDGAALAKTAGLPPARPATDDDLASGGGVGAALTLWRAASGLSRPQAGIALKTTPMTLTRWEDGAKPGPTGAHTIAIVLGLGYDRVLAAAGHAAATVADVVDEPWLPPGDRVPAPRYAEGFPLLVLHPRDLPRALKAWRAATQLTVPAAAERLHVRRDTYRGWESGRTLPQRWQTADLAEELQLSGEGLHALLHPHAAASAPRADLAVHHPVRVRNIVDLPLAVRAWRAAHRLTAPAAAKRLGVMPATVDGWEHGAKPNRTSLPLLARALDQPVDDLEVALYPPRPERPGFTADPADVDRLPDATRWGVGELPLALATWCGVHGKLWQDLAADLDVSPSAVSRWRAGGRVPEERARHRLARLLGWPIGELDRVAEATPPPTVASADGSHGPTGKYPAFAVAFTEARRAAGLTRGALADKLPVRTSLVAAWEDGRSRPPVWTRDTLARLLRMSRTELWLMLDADLPPPERRRAVPGLLALCAERGMRPRHIAEAAGVPLTDLAKWKSNGVPGVAIGRLAQALRTTPPALIAYLEKRYADEQAAAARTGPASARLAPRSGR